MGRKRLSKGIGRQLWHAVEGRCEHCGCDTYLPWTDEEHRLINQGPRMATLDHIVPVSKGGRNAHWNLQILCMECNSKKADKLPEEKRNVASN